jgi:NADH dehydrogenase
VVRVAVRDPEGATFLKPMGRVGQIVPLYTSVTDEATVRRAVADAELVVNLVGILAERRAGEFHAVQAEGAGRVARLAAAAGVSRLVHLSAIGADPSSPSAYARSKGEGEAQIRAHFPQATILRPSVVFGVEDQFFNRLGRMAELFPVMPVVCPRTRLQPVYVGDVADAVMQSLHGHDAPGRVFELGGPRVWTMEEIVGWVLAQTGRHRRIFHLPLGLARLLARLPGTGLTTDQLVLLQKDNVVSPGVAGLLELGIVPTPVDLVVPDYLAVYRRGGRRLAPAGMVPDRA